MSEAVWDDLLGQNSLVLHCKKMVASGRVPHALLISAPAGAGKSTLADILTRALLCENENAPCGVCPNCVKISHGNHPDVSRLGLAGKKTMGVEIAEQLQGMLAVKPYEGGRRVIVLEDAHALTVPAQNKLLKTLEEPPSSSVLILLCDNLSAMLPTIQSRCSVLRLQRVPRPELTQAIVSRCGLLRTRAQIIASLSDGWFARALELAGSDGIWQLRDEAFAILRYLTAPGGIFRAYQHITPLKSDWQQLISLLQTIFRDCMLDDPTLFIHVDREKELAEIRKRYDSSSLRKISAALSRAEIDLAQNANPALIMDALLLDLMAP